MSSINLVKKILADELFWRTCMNETEVENLVNSFVKILNDKRMTIAPTFLSDKMYNAQKESFPDMQYELANQLYKNAINELDREPNAITEDDYIESR